MSLKKVLSEDDIALVYGLAAAMTQKQIAEYLGMDENTFMAAKKRQPELLKAYKKGKARAIAGATSVLLDLINDKYFPAVAFYLKTQAGWREKGDSEIEAEDEDYKGPQPLLVKFEDPVDIMKEVKEVKDE